MIVEFYFSGVLIAVDLLDHKVENVNSALGPCGQGDLSLIHI